MAKSVFVIKDNSRSKLLMGPFVVSSICKLVFLANKHGNRDVGNMGDVDLGRSWLVVDLLVNVGSIVVLLEETSIEDLTIVEEALYAGSSGEVGQII